MATIENIIQNYNVIKEAGLAHRRHFKNTKATGPETWFNKREFAF